jgi:hypothetical protein
MVEENTIEEDLKSDTFDRMRQILSLNKNKRRSKVLEKRDEMNTIQTQRIQSRKNKLLLVENSTQIPRKNDKQHLKTSLSFKVNLKRSN